MRIIIVLMVLFYGSLAWASDDSSAQAEALYNDGRRLMDSGNFDSACPKFLASLELDPARGTLQRLALCYENQGKIASAWSKFKTLLTEAHRAQPEDLIRENFAKKHIAALEPKLSYLVIQVPDNQDGVIVTRDSIAAGPPIWGESIPVDPGEHSITAEANGKISWSVSVIIGPVSDSQTVTVPVLQSVPIPPPVPQPIIQTPVPIFVKKHNSRRPYAWIASSIGVGSIAIGSYFGIQALSNNNQVKQICPQGNCSNSAGVQLDNSAKLDATVSDISFAGGFVCLAAGVYLFLSEPKDPIPAGINISPMIGRTNGFSATMLW